MDGLHHVEHDLVGRIAAMHAPLDFAGRERATVAATIVELAVAGFQPVLEIETQHAPLSLVHRHVRDGAHPEERIRRASRRPARRGLQRRFALCFQCCHGGG
jgi:hypothetical protein